MNRYIISCKLFNVNKCRDISFVQYYSAILSPDHLFNLSRISFLLRLLFNGGLDSNSLLDKPDLSELFDLASFYQINLSDSKSIIMYKIWEKFKVSLTDSGILP